jgi:hypothetical protein
MFLVMIFTTMVCRTMFLVHCCAEEAHLQVCQHGSRQAAPNAEEDPQSLRTSRQSMGLLDQNLEVAHNAAAGPWYRQIPEDADFACGLVP